MTETSPSQQQMSVVQSAQEQQMSVVQSPQEQQMSVVQSPQEQQMSVVQCPPSLGLEPLLAGLESLWIHQKKDLIEFFLPIEVKNKYQITDHRGTQCCMAFEESNFAHRNLMGPGRPFKMYIHDNYGRMIFYCERPLQCCKDQVTVHLYDGTFLGSIFLTMTRRCNHAFDVFDQNSSKIFRISGPCCGISCQKSTKFDVFDVHSKKHVAQIRKEWAGFLKEITDADIFGVEFFIDLGVKMKAVIIGAVFLIDFLHYEK